MKHNAWLVGCMIMLVGTPLSATNFSRLMKEKKSAMKVYQELKGKLPNNGTFADDTVSKTDAEETSRPRSHRVVVKYKSTTRRSRLLHNEQEESLFSHDEAGARSVSHGDLDRVFVRTYPDDVDVSEMANELSVDPDVEYAFPSMMFEALEVPNDYFYEYYDGSRGYDAMWNLKTINADHAWDITKGEGVIVAVVDTGIDYRHEDVPNLVPGWDFTLCKRYRHDQSCVEKSEDNDPLDRAGHGTHVSGTIAAVGNNGVGIIGVAPRAKIMALKALTDDGWGEDTWLAKAIVWAADHGARVINNSWGCDYCPSNPLVEEAVRYADAQRVVVIMAAGNGSADIRFSSPQNMDETITVSACDPNDERAFFSNWGERNDVCAPGSGFVDISSDKAFEHALYNIPSLRARKGRGLGSKNLRIDPSNKKYFDLAGTSMAAPHVSGVAALLLSRQPNLSPREIKAIIGASARDVATQGFDIFTGNGMLDAYRALLVDTVLTSDISSPSSGLVLNPDTTSAYTVRGSANGNGFSNYELFLGGGRTPQTWQSVTGQVSTPVDNGPLTVLHLADIPNRSYLLRLVSRSAGEAGPPALSADRPLGGWEFQDVVRLYVDRPATRLVPLEIKQVDPNAFGNNVVWNEFDGLAARSENSHLRLYDGATDTSVVLPGTNPNMQYFPHMSGQYIVAQQWNNARGDLDIVEYDLATDPITVRTIVDAPDDQSEPDINGTTEAWLDCAETRSLDACWFALKRHIVVRNMLTGATRRITDKLESRAELSIVSNRIVFMQHDGSIWRLRMIDLDTGADDWLMPSSGFDQFGPRCDVETQICVWYELHDGAMWYGVRAIHLATRETWWLTPSGIAAGYPDIADNMITYADYDNGNLDIAVQNVYDAAGSTKQYLTAYPSHQSQPTIAQTLDGWRVSWVDYRWDGHNWVHYIASKIVH